MTTNYKLLSIASFSPEQNLYILIFYSYEDSFCKVTINTIDALRRITRYTEKIFAYKSLTTFEVALLSRDMSLILLRCMSLQNIKKDEY